MSNGKSENSWDLNELSDSSKFQDSIDIIGNEKDDLIEYLKLMVKIRCAERRLAIGKRDGEIGGPVHLGVGQEAVAVGVSALLRKTDRVFGAHRSHSHVLALGANLHHFFSEILGKDTGLSRGMGGSMHLSDPENGFYGSVPIVAGTVSLAVGAGLAAKIQAKNDIGVAYLGDGAVEEGVVHESLNLARITKSPVLFVVENNLFASHMHISLRQPKEATARFAAANDMPYEIVDGNNILQVREAAKRLIDHARAGKGPGYLEAVTYRWYGHVDWREDIDVGVKRSSKDVSEWRKRDPIARLVTALETEGILMKGEAKEIEESTVEAVSKAWTFAQADPYPEDSTLLSRVYAEAKI